MTARSFLTGERPCFHRRQSRCHRLMSLRAGGCTTASFCRMNIRSRRFVVISAYHRCRRLRSEARLNNARAFELRNNFRDTPVAAGSCSITTRSPGLYSVGRACRLSKRIFQRLRSASLFAAAICRRSFTLSIGESDLRSSCTAANKRF